MTSVSDTSTPGESEPSRFRDWEASRRATQVDALAHSRRVRRLRVLLPVIAGLLLAGFIGVATLRSVDESFLLRFAGLTRDGEGLRMVNPSFSGLDSSGRAFLVTADSAEQDEVRNDRIDLVRPLAQAAVDTPEQATVTSERGVFFNNEKLLNLSGDVVMLYGGDYVFRTEKASLSFEDKRMYGDEPIEGEGPAGRLRADGFEAFDDGGRLLFSGDVRMRVTPSSKSSGDRPQ